MNKLETMKRFAHEAHKNQMYGPHPYTYHLDKVLGVAKRYTNDIDILCGGKIEKYKKEQEDLEKYLYKKEHNEDLWKELRSLFK
jgi:hypothetical protein